MAGCLLVATATGWAVVFEERKVGGRPQGDRTRASAVLVLSYELRLAMEMTITSSLGTELWHRCKILAHVPRAFATNTRISATTDADCISA